MQVSLQNGHTFNFNDICYILLYLKYVYIKVNLGRNLSTKKSLFHLFLQEHTLVHQVLQIFL